MFFISMPDTLKVGESADCRINQRSTRVTWREQNTLVIGENDARRIIQTWVEDGLRNFCCKDANRWTAVIHYDLCTTTTTFEELEELQEIVEHGPNFNTIKLIEVTYNLRAAT